MCVCVALDNQGVCWSQEGEDHLLVVGMRPLEEAPVPTTTSVVRFFNCNLCDEPHQHDKATGPLPDLCTPCKEKHTKAEGRKRARASTERSHKIKEDLASLQVTLQSKEKELASLKAIVQSKEQDLDALTEELSALRVEKEALEANCVERGATARPPQESAVVDDADLPGCTVYRGALDRDACLGAVPRMKQCAIASKEVIRAQQRDKKRLLGEVDEADALRAQLHRVLRETHELDGRTPRDWFALHSLVGCAKQRLHYDYPPDVVANLGLRGGRKPRSVLLALEEGTRLHVRHPSHNASVVVLLGPGDVIVFDGDVAHAGSGYRAENTRLHVPRRARGATDAQRDVGMEGCMRVCKRKVAFFYASYR